MLEGEFFVHIGEKPTDMGFILSGIFRTFSVTESGNEIITDFCMEGDVTGSMNILNNTKAEQAIQALEDCSLLSINYNDYLNFLAGHKCWHDLNKMLTESFFIHKAEREKELLLYDAENRYKRFLKEFPGIEKRVRQYHIASYLGITPIALSRIRKKISASA